MLLREFWNDRFWPHCTRNLRESTRVGYESAWRLHVMPCFGGMGMDAISVELVDKWLANFDTAGAARQYKGWCKRHDLPHVPARNLRRSWATNALAAGADIAIVSKMLGHSDIKTTAKYYLKPDITALRDAQRLWERALIA